MSKYPDAIKRGQKRVFIQEGGSLPTNPLKYHGKDTQYLAFSGANRPVRGSVAPIRTSNPDNPSSWVNVGRTVGPADFPTSTITVMEREGSIPFTMTDFSCPITAYLPTGACGTPSDFDNGWNSYVEIWGNGLVTAESGGDRVSHNSDDAVETSLSLTWDYKYAIGAIQLSLQNETLVTTPGLDVAYGAAAQCSGCGKQNDGTRYRYSLHGGAAAAKPYVLYSGDYGQSWASVNIDAAANNEQPNTLLIVGKYCVVISPTANTSTNGGYYYVEINQDTGAPGATWTKVTSGFVNNQQPRDAFAYSDREILVVGDLGTVYRLTYVGDTAVPTTIGAQDLLKIHALGDTILIGAESGKTYWSFNRGQTFAVSASDADAANITSVWLLGRKYGWVVTSDGQVYSTQDGGSTWRESRMPGTAPSACQDAVFPTPEVGYVLATVGGVAALFYTSNAGVTWNRAGNNSPRILTQPSYLSNGRIAVPDISPAIDSSRLLICGTATGGTDGILLMGESNIR